MSLRFITQNQSQDLLQIFVAVIRIFEVLTKKLALNLHELKVCTENYLLPVFTKKLFFP